MRINKSPLYERLLKAFRVSAEELQQVKATGDPKITVKSNMTYTTVEDRSITCSITFTVIHNIQVTLWTGGIEAEEHVQYLTRYFFKLDKKPKRKRCPSLIRSAPSSRDDWRERESD